MISYCIAAYRPTYCKLLVEDLIKKTSTPYEILVWLNVEDLEFEKFLRSNKNVVIVGKTPENIGMLAYESLFKTAKYDMIVQIDDDVICVSRHIAERASYIFDKFPDVKQLVADVWQDELISGARPSMDNYKTIDENEGLFEGPIDGWFNIFHRSVLHKIKIKKKYQYIGAELVFELSKDNLKGLLYSKIKVLHINSPQYANYFNMLDFEIDKYRNLGLTELADLYENSKLNKIPNVDMFNKLILIFEHLDKH
jgi:hypothetical protein